MRPNRKFIITYTTGNNTTQVTINFSITYFDTISVSNSIYLIGGLSDGIASKDIRRFKNGEWSKYGELLNARYGHQSIPVNNGSILVCGGFSFTPPP